MSFPRRACAQEGRSRGSEAARRARRQTTIVFKSLAEDQAKNEVCIVCTAAPATADGLRSITENGALSARPSRRDRMSGMPDRAKPRLWILRTVEAMPASSSVEASRGVAGTKDGDGSRHDMQEHIAPSRRGRARRARFRAYKTRRARRFKGHEGVQMARSSPRYAQRRNEPRLYRDCDRRTQFSAMRRLRGEDIGRSRTDAKR